MTAYADTADVNEHRLRTAFIIEGVPYVFTDADFTASDFQDEQASNRTQLQVIEAESLNVGESRVDLEQRRELGATLSVRLRDTTAAVLLGLFKPRADPTTFVTSTIARTTAMTGGGTLTLDSTSALPSSGTVYIGAESFDYSGKTATTLTSVYRAYYGGRPQRHLGGTRDEVAASVYEHPPAWTGRRLTLYGGYADSDGTIEDVQALGTWVLNAPPQPVAKDTWELSAESLAAGFAARTVYAGLQEVEPDIDTLANQDTITLSTDAGKMLHISGGGATRRGHVMMQLGGGWQSLRAATPAAFSVTVDGPDFCEPTYPDVSAYVPANIASIAAPRIHSLRYVVYQAGVDPIDATLELLCSYLGDQVEDATYDVHPGRERTNFGEPEWYFGARLADDVDVSSFEEFRGVGFKWTVFLDEPMTVGDLLFECCLATGTFWYVNSSGKLALKRISENLEPSLTAPVALADADLHPEGVDALELIEADIFHTATFRANWDPLNDEYRAIVNVNDQDIANQYPNTSRTLEYESRFASVRLSRAPTRRGTPSQSIVRAGHADDSDIEWALRRAQLRSARAKREMTFTATWAKSLINVGDVVTVTNSRIPDCAGATLSGVSAMVIGKRPDFQKGSVVFRLALRGDGSQIAPAAIVSSYSAGPPVRLTLQTGDEWLTDGNQPAREFGGDWACRLHHLSGAGSPTVEDVTITNIQSDTQLDLTSAPTFTPVAGDVLTVGDASSTTNQDGWPADDVLFQTADAPTGSPTRWL